MRLLHVRFSPFCEARRDKALLSWYWKVGQAAGKMIDLSAARYAASERFRLIQLLPRSTSACRSASDIPIASINAAASASGDWPEYRIPPPAAATISEHPPASREQIGTAPASQASITT